MSEKASRAAKVRLLDDGLEAATEKGGSWHKSKDRRNKMDWWLAEERWK